MTDQDWENLTWWLRNNVDIALQELPHSRMDDPQVNALNAIDETIEGFRENPFLFSIPEIDKIGS